MTGEPEQATWESSDSLFWCTYMHPVRANQEYSMGCLLRRGAAFGLAGIIKGLGVSALNRYGTMEALRKALDDQANADAREGALFAFECMCEKLGRYGVTSCQAAICMSRSYP